MPSKKTPQLKIELIGNAGVGYKGERHRVGDKFEVDAAVARRWERSGKCRIIQSTAEKKAEKKAEKAAE